MAKLKLIIAALSLAFLFVPQLVWHVIIIILLIILSFSQLRELKSAKFWTIFGVTAFLPSVILHSTTVLYFCALIFTRSLILYLALLLLANSLPLNMVNKYLPKIVGMRLATIISLAFNLFPTIRNIVIKNHALFYFRSHNLSRLRYWMHYIMVVFKQIVAAADACAENMLLVEQVRTPKIFIITGPKHSGKTTKLQHLIIGFKEHGWPVTGVIAPSLMQDNRRSTIFVQNVATNEKHLLALRDAPIRDCLYEYGGFNFSATSYTFAKQALMNFIPKGIVVLDEYGPLEFAGLGYAEEFSQLLQANVSAIFIVVREELVSRFIDKYSLSHYAIIHAPLVAVTAIFDRNNLEAQSHSCKDVAGSC